MKQQISATISKKVFDEWKKFCSDNCINASQLIEKVIQDHMKKQKEKK
jgi:hypothetical protein